MTETLSLRVKIEQSPMGAYQWMIVVMAAIMNLLDGFDVLALAFTATAIRGEFGLTGIELGYLLSAGLFGMTAGSLFLAPLADKIGRRPLLLMAVSLSAIGMLGSAFIHNINGSVSGALSLVLVSASGARKSEPAVIPNKPALNK